MKTAGKMSILGGLLSAVALGSMAGVNAFKTATRPGREIYAMADLLGSVWVIADVFEQDMDLLKIGQPAKVVFNARPGKEFKAKIDYIYPILNAMTRTTQVRLDVANPEAVIFGAMYGDVQFAVGKGKGKVATVPKSAVIYSGTRQLVLVQLAEGRFEPREVKIGIEGDNYVEVLKGVAVGENVVTAANFLIDSESSLTAAVAGFGQRSGNAGGATPSSKGESPSMQEMTSDPDRAGHMKHDGAPPKPEAAPRGEKHRAVPASEQGSAAHMRH